MLAGYSYGLRCYECQNHPVYGTGQGCGDKVTHASEQVKEVSCSQQCMISKDLQDGDYIFYRGCGCTEVNKAKSVVKCCSTDKCNADLDSASRDVTAGATSYHLITAYSSSYLVLATSLIVLIWTLPQASIFP